MSLYNLSYQNSGKYDYENEEGYRAFRQRDVLRRNHLKREWEYDDPIYGLQKGKLKLYPEMKFGNIHSIKLPEQEKKEYAYMGESAYQEGGKTKTNREYEDMSLYNLSFQSGGWVEKGMLPVLPRQLSDEEIHSWRVPGYIQDKGRRDEQIRNIVYNLMDSGVRDRYTLKKTLTNLSGYGGERGGLATKGSDFGFDYKDIDDKRIDNIAHEYMNKLYSKPKFQDGGGVKPIYVNDSILKAYQDSLTAYNFGQKKQKEANQIFKELYPNEKIYRYIVPHFKQEYTNKFKIKPINEIELAIPVSLEEGIYENFSKKVEMLDYPVYKKPTQPVIYQSKQKIKSIPIDSLSIATQTPFYKKTIQKIKSQSPVFQWYKPGDTYRARIDIPGQPSEYIPWKGWQKRILELQKLYPGLIKGRIQIPSTYQDGGKYGMRHDKKSQKGEGAKILEVNPVPYVPAKKSPAELGLDLQMEAVERNRNSKNSVLGKYSPMNEPYYPSPKYERPAWMDKNTERKYLEEELYKSGIKLPKTQEYSLLDDPTIAVAVTATNPGLGAWLYGPDVLRKVADKTLSPEKAKLAHEDIDNAENVVGLLMLGQLGAGAGKYLGKKIAPKMTERIGKYIDNVTSIKDPTKLLPKYNRGGIIPGGSKKQIYVKGGDVIIDNAHLNKAINDGVLPAKKAQTQAGTSPITVTENGRPEGLIPTENTKQIERRLNMKGKTLNDYFSSNAPERQFSLYYQDGGIINEKGQKMPIYSEFPNVFDPNTNKYIPNPYGWHDPYGRFIERRFGMYYHPGSNRYFPDSTNKIGFDRNRIWHSGEEEEIDTNIINAVKDELRNPNRLNTIPSFDLLMKEFMKKTGKSPFIKKETEYQTGGFIPKWRKKYMSTEEDVPLYDTEPYSPEVAQFQQDIKNTSYLSEEEQKRALGFENFQTVSDNIIKRRGGIPKYIFGEFGEELNPIEGITHGGAEAGGPTYEGEPGGPTLYESPGLTEEQKLQRLGTGFAAAEAGILAGKTLWDLTRKPGYVPRGTVPEPKYIPFDISPERTAFQQSLARSTAGATRRAREMGINPVTAAAATSASEYQARTGFETEAGRARRATEQTNTQLANRYREQKARQEYEDRLKQFAYEQQFYGQKGQELTRSLFDLGRIGKDYLDYRIKLKYPYIPQYSYARQKDYTPTYEEVN